MSILPTIHTKAGTVTNTLKIQANLDLRNIEKKPFNHEKSLKLGVLFIDYMSDFVIQGHFCNKNQNKLSFPKQFNYIPSFL